LVHPYHSLMSAPERNHDRQTCHYQYVETTEKNPIQGASCYFIPRKVCGAGEGEEPSDPKVAHHCSVAQKSEGDGLGSHIQSVLTGLRRLYTAYRFTNAIATRTNGRLRLLGAAPKGRLAILSEWSQFAMNR